MKPYFIFFVNFISYLPPSIALTYEWDTVRKHVLSPRYEFAKDNFNVSGLLTILQPHSCEKIGDDFSDKIVLYKETSCAFETVSRICEAGACKGTIGAHSEPNLLGFRGHTIWTWVVPNAPDVPMVEVYMGDVQELFDLFERDETAQVIATMTSGDPNPFTSALHSFWTTFTHGFCFTLSLWVVFRACVKLLDFTASKSRRLPWVPVGVLVPEAIANLMRALLSANFAVLDNQLLPKRIYRLFGTTHPFLAQLSNCALIIGLRQHYELISTPSTKQKLLFSIGSTAIIVLMSLHATVEIAAFFTGIEYMSVQQLLQLHVPLHTLISGAFIYYGNSVANKLLLSSGNAKATVSGSDSVYKRRLQFVRGVRLSGYSMVSNLFTAVAFGVMGVKSALAYITLLGLVNTTTTITSYFQVTAIRPPASIFGKLCCNWDLSRFEKNAGQIKRTLSPEQTSEVIIKFPSRNGELTTTDSTLVLTNKATTQESGGT